jgi:hypothetical protein
MKLPFLFLLLLAGCSLAHADEESCKAARDPASSDHGWHLLVITNGGVVTLLKDLTHKEAEYSRARTIGTAATAKECDEADKREAERVRMEDERRKADEALIRAKAPKCPVGETEGDDHGPNWDAWYKKHEKDAPIKLTPNSMCGETNTVQACLLPDWAIKVLFIGACMGLPSMSGSQEAMMIKSAEVFR